MSHYTILIIDDVPDHRDFLRRLLRGAGFRVIEANPGAEALDAAGKETPDLILTALSLPGQPSWETARLLRALPSLVGTPILGATVFNTLLSRSRVRAIGCADFVDKPFDLDELLLHIAALLPPKAPLALIAA
ncbi:MAG: response regulator [Kouleothrix sp.]|nr:response regulator [Kouleothrix sp.]